MQFDEESRVEEFDPFPEDVIVGYAQMYDT
jgi:hypothetical protein